MTPDPQWTPEHITEVLEYEAKATPGPWTSVHENHKCLISAGVHGGGSSTIRLVTSTEATKTIRENANNDVDFMARARTDLPSAVREIQRLTPFMEAFRDSGLPETWELEHPAMKYVTIQVDKSDWLKMRALLDAAEEAAK